MRLAVLLAPLLLGGCVERLISVRSEPPGAAVYLDGERAGETPCEIRYAWYGTRTLTLEKAGYSSISRDVPLRPPWWQIFPLDFITDILIPITLSDRTELHFLLREEKRERVDPDAIKKRADELREKTKP